jgi:hypothetical protein
MDRYEHEFDNGGMMSTPEQILSSALHGEALRRVDRPEIRALIAELAELAQGRDDVRTEAAGTLAGAWFAEPASSYAEELVAAGLLLLAGPVDGDLITERVREGTDRRRRASNSYNPSR